LILTFWRTTIGMAVGGVTLGLAFGAASQVGRVSLESQQEGRDFGLRVVAGGTAKFEFLKQLVGPGERNFSRIASAMSKYGFEPSASTPGAEVPRLEIAKKWLLIQPDAGQLPRPEALIAHLKSGGDFTVILAPEQAPQPKIREWLNALGLYAQDTVALALTEDARLAQEGLLSRRGAALMRDTRTLTKALPTSLLKDRQADQFFQSYTVRPTVFPRTSGLLNIGFSSDQFSDASIGDVWEGIEPSSIGRLRERQLASALVGEDLPSPFPGDLSFASPSIVPSSLPAYLLMEDGKTVLAGRFDPNTSDIYSQLLSPIENPVGYLFDLRARAAAFVVLACPRNARITKCRTRMLGPDMIEWAISWASGVDGTIIAIELLHERSFSGLGTTLNVIFGE
jgi:hypothetical protein